MGRSGEQKSLSPFCSHRFPLTSSLWFAVIHGQGISRAVGQAPPVLRRDAKFCLVGATGTGVDMLLLHLLASDQGLGRNLGLSKALAAEAGLINNFLWNDRWPFGGLVEDPETQATSRPSAVAPGPRHSSLDPAPRACAVSPSST